MFEPVPKCESFSKGEGFGSDYSYRGAMTHDVEYKSARLSIQDTQGGGMRGQTALGKSSLDERMTLKAVIPSFLAHHPCYRRVVLHDTLVSL